ncbi:MAG: caspase family protein [Elusimicrobiota bacterium]
MKFLRWAGLSLITLSASACIAPAPPARDTLADLNLIPANAGLKGLTVAVITAQNTKNSIAYLRSILSKTRTREDPATFFVSYKNMLRRHFRATVHVDSVADAKSRAPDLIAILDVHATLPSHSSAKFAAKLILISPEDDQEIETLSVAGEGSDTSLLEDRRLHMSIGTAAEDGRAKLEKALLASQALAEYAKARRSPKTLAAAPASPPARTYSSDVDNPGYQARENQANFAVVVGISQYKHLPEAEFAQRDAEAVKRHLLAIGYPERNIILLTGDNATRTSLQKYLEEWLPKNLKPDSRLFFYYSGHGAPDAATSEAFLVPWDGDAQFLQSTAYPVRQLYQSLEALPAKEVVVALDACFSGAGGRSVLAKGARPLVTTVTAGSVPAGKITLFAAASGDQITSTLEEKGHGIFTYYFLKGLSEAAKGPGEVTPQRLFDYLKPLVEDAARRQNRDQTPVLAGSRKDHAIVTFK